MTIHPTIQRAALPPWQQECALWAPRTKAGGVRWRIFMRGIVPWWEPRAEMRFLVRFGLALGIVGAPVLEILHLLRVI